LLARGVATVVFDGPGLGETFHRMSMVAEPRPVGHAIVNALQERPELDPEAIAFFGQSLGGYLAIRMAAYDSRIRAVAAVSPPYSADVYWNVTLVGMRRELAALYGLSEAEMGREVHRITLDGAITNLHCPLMVSGGGRDLITPGEEAWRIYDAARCERELVFYPRGGHDCFNMLGDLRPRMTTWLARQLKLQRSRSRRPYPVYEANGEAKRLLAAEAVDPDFADALTGDVQPRRWFRPESQTMPARWALDGIDQRPSANVEIVLRRASATAA
jgi:pimeloyl-ACP methyl ester carboxylesterase